MERYNWQNACLGVIGVWLIISPWALNYLISGAVSPGRPEWNFAICGFVVLVIGVALFSVFSAFGEWLEIAVGVWLIASPWVLNFSQSQTALINAIVSGSLIVLISGAVLATQRDLRHF